MIHQSEGITWEQRKRQELLAAHPLPWKGGWRHETMADLIIASVNATKHE